MNFPLLDDDFLHRPSYKFQVSQFINFARKCSQEDHFNDHNIFLINFSNKVIGIISIE